MKRILSIFLVLCLFLTSMPMVFAEVDKTLLDAKITEVTTRLGVVVLEGEALPGEEYTTPEARTLLQEKLVLAEGVNTSSESVQVDVDNALTELTDALIAFNLVVSVEPDKGLLDLKIEEVTIRLLDVVLEGEAGPGDEYSTPEARTLLQEALALSEAVSVDAFATQEVIDSSLATLSQALVEFDAVVDMKEYRTIGTLENLITTTNETMTELYILEEPSIVPHGKTWLPLTEMAYATAVTDELNVLEAFVLNKDATNNFDAENVVRYHTLLDLLTAMHAQTSIIDVNGADLNSRLNTAETILGNTVITGDGLDGWDVASTSKFLTSDEFDMFNLVLVDARNYYDNLPPGRTQAQVDVYKDSVQNVIDVSTNFPKGKYNTTYTPEQYTDLQTTITELLDALEITGNKFDNPSYLDLPIGEKYTMAPKQLTQAHLDEITTLLDGVGATTEPWELAKFYTQNWSMVVNEYANLITHSIDTTELSNTLTTIEGFINSIVVTEDPDTVDIGTKILATQGEKDLLLSKVVDISNIKDSATLTLNQYSEALTLLSALELEYFELPEGTIATGGAVESLLNTIIHFLNNAITVYETEDDLLMLGEGVTYYSKADRDAKLVELEALRPADPSSMTTEEATLAYNTLQDMYLNFISTGTENVLDRVAFDAAYSRLMTRLNKTDVGTATSVGRYSTTQEAYDKAMLDKTTLDTTVGDADPMTQNVLNAATELYTDIFEALDLASTLRVSLPTGDTNQNTPQTPNPAPTPQPQQPVDVKTESSVETTKEDEEGKKEVIVEVDTTKLDTLLKQQIKNIENNNTIEKEVTVKVQTKGDKTSVTVNKDIVDSLEKEDFKLKIESDGISYKLKAKEISKENVSKKLGVKSEDIDEIDISILIEKTDTEPKLEEGTKLLSDVTSFKIVAKTKDRTGTEKETNISNFETYVTRVIKLTNVRNRDEIGTGVVVTVNGVQPVPTRIYKENGVYYAELSSLTNSEYTVISSKAKVDSVKGHWSEEVVNRMVSNMVVTDTKNYSPDKAITREDFIVYLTKAMGIYRDNSIDYAHKFKDVTDKNDLAAISAASEYNLVEGYPEGVFKPSNLLTREEAMVLISRAVAIAEVEDINTLRITTFKDYSEVSTWAKDGALSAIRKGLVQGQGNNTLAPKSNITHSETLEILYNILNKSGLSD